VPGSWQQLHPGLLEVFLGLGVFTIVQEMRVAFQPLALVAAALLAETAGGRLPWHLARVRAYGRVLYGLAALTALGACLSEPTPSQPLGAEWWAVAAATAALFAYVALALQAAARWSPAASAARLLWPRGLEFLEGWLLPSFRVLVAGLLYPALLVLALLLVQSFSKSVLTVLLMLEVFGIFTASLALRRAHLRYTALLGMAACLVRLVFFDLNQSHTLARAVVFIFMGLLLLGMNALYARFRNRTGAEDETATPPEPAETPSF
jgi:uncharacterized membrane protein (DUF373 family)